MIWLFRIILLINLSAYLIWYFFPHLNAVILDDDEYALLTYSGLGAYFTPPEWGHWLALASTVVIYLGLYFLIPVFRMIFVLYLLVNFVMQFSSGMVVLTGIESVILSFLNITDGLILSLLFLSSISVEFRNRKGSDHRMC